MQTRNYGEYKHDKLPFPPEKAIEGQHVQNAEQSKRPWKIPHLSSLPRSRSLAPEKMDLSHKLGLQVEPADICELLHGTPCDKLLSGEVLQTPLALAVNGG